jgi:uncharacterized cupin superfamily protein
VDRASSSKHRLGTALPSHVHRNDDESFYVIDGEITFLRR